MKVPPPVDEDEAVLTPMADSLLSYLTRSLDGAEGVVYEKLADEVLSQAHCPHVKFMVLPRLVNMKLNLGALIQSVLEGVAKQEVASNEDLLYSIIQLGDSRLQSGDLEEGLLVKYLHLLSLLMEQSPSGMDVPISEEDDEDDEEEEETMEEEGRGRKSDGGVFQHCLNLIGGRHTANILHTRE